MSKPKDRRAGKLREQYDELEQYDTQTTRKLIRDAKRDIKKAMTKHDRNAGKRDLQQRIRGDDDDE